MKRRTSYLFNQIAKTFNKSSNNANKLINAEVELGQRPRTVGYSRLMAPYPSGTYVMVSLTPGRSNRPLSGLHSALTLFHGAVRLYERRNEEETKTCKVSTLNLSPIQSLPLSLSNNLTKLKIISSPSLLLMIGRGNLPPAGTEFAQWLVLLMTLNASFNNNTLPQPTLYIDNLYNKLAELSTFLAGQDIPKSPDGWVRLSTLKSYDGVDVMGNRHPTSQDTVASKTFSVSSGGKIQNSAGPLLFTSSGMNEDACATLESLATDSSTFTSNKLVAVLQTSLHVRPDGFLFIFTVWSGGVSLHPKNI